MPNEASHFASMLEYIGRDVLQQLHTIPEQLLNQPLIVEDTNTLFALATHLVGLTCSIDDFCVANTLD